MKILPRLALILTVCAIAVSALAQNPVGKWKGTVDMSGVRPKTQQEKEVIAQLKTVFGKAVLTLELKSNKAFSSTFSGAGNMKPKTETGTWSQNGRTITMKGAKQSENMTISADGKSMTILPPASDKSVPKGVKVVFKRV